MGLLDDAIREHLDLKRARGGDPAEIERMEREALGPVRREPTIGSARFEAVDEQMTAVHEDVYEDDLVELQDVGYHDSTAPHPHARHEHSHRRHELVDPHGELEDEHDPFGLRAEEPEQPRRRFLRRNRPTSLSDVTADPGFHEEPAVDPLYPMEHHEFSEQHEPLDHEPLAHDELLEHEHPPHEPLEHAEPLGHEDLSEHEPPTQTFPAETPPHLQFEHPPKRPRFTAEPPSLRPEADEESPAEADTASHEAPAPPPAPATEPEDLSPPQETTEFDVQRHIAETRHLAEEPPAKPAGDTRADEAGGDTPADEDVLEETPEFLQDTPEHDRLWFEQRPPKDFDF